MVNLDKFQKNFRSGFEVQSQNDIILFLLSMSGGYIVFNYFFSFIGWSTIGGVIGALLGAFAALKSIENRNK